MRIIRDEKTILLSQKDLDVMIFDFLNKKDIDTTNVMEYHLLSDQ